VSTCYTTPTRFRAIALGIGAIGDITDDELLVFLVAASKMAESLGLRSRYKLPLTSWGEDIEQQVCHVAIWPVMTREGYNPEPGQNNTYRAITEKAENWFRDVALKRVHPDVTDSAKRSPAPTAWSNPKRGW
jgi:hypothetical protein